MSELESSQHGTFDLDAIEREMRQEESYRREGHTARTLVRAPDLRVVLVAIKGGSRIAEHHANASASVQTIAGLVRLHIQGRTVELPAGQLLILERGLKHDVEAATDSAFVLTLGWRNE
jgi:quercetin dioxygenase-like cupin family protein